MEDGQRGLRLNTRRARRPTACGDTEDCLFDPEPVHHPVADALEAISAWLDAHPELLDGITADPAAAARGRAGLSCETVLRCAVLKHLRQETWRGLEFTLRDSASARRFVRAEPNRLPKKSALQATVGAAAPDTWERVNRCLLRTAHDSGVETGARLRVDSTVTETHILAPADSRLLYNGIRLLTRVLRQARQHLGGEAIAFHDHRRAAKRRYLEAGAQRGRERRAHTYRRLLRPARRALGHVDGALPVVATTHAPWAHRWTRDVPHYAELLRRVMDQAERRVLPGESVPAADKIVSLFEPRADIVRKGGRDTFYGHKVNLATGRGGLVLDAVVEPGNPPDSTRCLTMLERHQEHYGAVPGQCPRTPPSTVATPRATTSRRPRHSAWRMSCSTRRAASYRPQRRCSPRDPRVVGATIRYISEKQARRRA